jgi:hypothetical protein
MLSLRPLSTTDPATRTDVWVAAAEDTLANAAVGVSDAMRFGPVGLGVGVGVAVAVTEGLGVGVLPAAAPDDPPPQPATRHTAALRRAGPPNRHLMSATLIKAACPRGNPGVVAPAALPLMAVSQR